VRPKDNSARVDQKEVGPFDRGLDRAVDRRLLPPVTRPMTLLTLDGPLNVAVSSLSSPKILKL